MSYQDLKLQYSPDWKGPVEKRTTTDRPFIVAFLVLMACWAGVAIYAISQGDLAARLAPVDSRDRRCGIDNEVADAPYLVFFDLTWPADDDGEGVRSYIRDGERDWPYRKKSKTLAIQAIQEENQNSVELGSRKICRKECPTTDWHYQIVWNEQSVEEIRKNIMCLNDVDVSEKTKSEMRDLIDTDKCAKWYLRSTSLVGRCVPDRVPTKFPVPFSKDGLKNIRKAIMNSVWGGPILATTITTRGSVLGFIGSSGFLCLLYVYLLKWIAFPCTLISSAVLTAIYSYLSYVFYGSYRETMDGAFLAYSIIFGVLAGLTVFMVLYLYRRMRKACELIKETSEAVMSMFASLMFPILPWLLQLTATVHFIVVALYLLTIEGLEDWLCGLLFTVHVTGFLWFYFFVTAFVEMCLAFTFATWYWSFDKRQVTHSTILAGASKTFRYHLGTVAFGSLLITICRMIRILLSMLRNSRSRGIGAFLAVCADFIMSYVEKFLKFMNRNAYIMCAVYGKGLCSSASAAMELILRNALTAILLNNMVSWVLWLGKFLIAGTTGILAFWYYNEYDQERYQAAFLAAAGAFVIADMFCSVYVVGVDCIFLCFLEDRERNDGSPSRPYYMSQRLRSLLHKEIE